MKRTSTSHAIPQPRRPPPPNRSPPPYHAQYRQHLLVPHTVLYSIQHQTAFRTIPTHYTHVWYRIYGSREEEVTSGEWQQTLHGTLKISVPQHAPLAACPQTAVSRYTSSLIQAPGAYTYARHPCPLKFVSLVREHPWFCYAVHSDLQLPKLRQSIICRTIVTFEYNALPHPPPSLTPISFSKELASRRRSGMKSSGTHGDQVTRGASCIAVH